jgi:hypothetical protein
VTRVAVGSAGPLRDRGQGGRIRRPPAVSPERAPNR